MIFRADYRAAGANKFCGDSTKFPTEVTEERAETTSITINVGGSNESSSPENWVNVFEELGIEKFLYNVHLSCYLFP